MKYPDYLEANVLGNQAKGSEFPLRTGDQHDGANGGAEIARHLLSQNDRRKRRRIIQRILARRIARGVGRIGWREGRGGAELHGLEQLTDFIFVGRKYPLDDR